MSGRFLTRASHRERRLKLIAGFDEISAAALFPLLGILHLLLSGGCAQIEPPRGGPADTDPPRVMATFPDSGAVMVPLVDSIAIVFSEPMDRASVESSFFLSPSVEYRERSWEKQTWILRLREPLRENQTYVGLVGTGIRDRQRLSPRAPWSFAFTTGESLDTDAIAGRVIGQRYRSGGALIYAWPWEHGLPDTLVEGFPEDPIRLGQADGQGEYRLGHLPRGRPLQVCAMFDREQNRRFDPKRDRWGCLDEPLTLCDSLPVREGVDLFITSPGEPGTVAGALVDSSCVLAAVTSRMARIRARRDSLYEWTEHWRTVADSVIAVSDSLEAAIPDSLEAMENERESGAEDSMAEDMFLPDERAPGAGWVRGLTVEDSLRIEGEYLLLDAEELAARNDSLWCAPPLVAHLIDQDSVVVKESFASPTFSWSDVPPGVYTLLGFRDMNGNRLMDPGEPGIRYPHSIVVRPLRVMDGLDLVLPSILEDPRIGAGMPDSTRREIPVGDGTPAEQDHEDAKDQR